MISTDGFTGEVQKLLQITKECNVDSQSFKWRTLYSTLSSNIHNYRWKWFDVKVLTTGLSNIELCVIQRLVHDRGLRMFTVDKIEDEDDEEDGDKDD